MIPVRAITHDDRPWAEQLLREAWGDRLVVTRGRVHDAARLEGFVAECDGERAGLITWRRDGPAWEIVTLNSVAERRGVGTGLVEAVRAAAAEAGCRRLWLITTNDNLRALRFWQRRGFELAVLHRGACAESRRLKPSIPEVGQHGIPIQDELELELPL